MFRFIIIFIGFVFSTSLLTGQTTVNFDNYKPIVSSGTTEIFSKTSSETYREAYSKGVSRKDKRKIRKAKDEFYLKSTFQIADILKSGIVLYNDPVGEYINSVFDEILKSVAPNYLGKVNLLVIKTNYSNAFATDAGYIFVTTGLISRLENEAQLAFVLCHELVHFQKKHSIDIFLNNTVSGDDKKNDISINNETSTESLLKQAAYSQEKETEADKEGMRLFLKTKYNPYEAIKSFNLISSSVIPFGNETFSPSFFDTKNFKWADSLYLLQKPNKLNLEGSENDKTSTHPNINKRKKYLLDILGKDSTKASYARSISSKNFEKAKTICLYEYCRLALLDQTFTEAIFVASKLLKYYPKSVYLKKTIGKGLYYFSFFSRKRRDDLYGDADRLNYFLAKLGGKELLELSAHYWWGIHTRFSQDFEARIFSKKTLSILCDSYYKSKSVSSINDTSKAAQEIREVFDEYLQNDSFVAAFSQTMIPSSAKEETSNNNSSSSRLSGRKVLKAKGKKILILSPLNYSIDRRKKIQLRYEASEKKQIKFNEQITFSAKEANVPITLLSESNITNDNIASLNILYLINSWLSFQADTNKSNLLTVDLEEITSFINQEGIEYLGLIGSLYLIEKKTKIDIRKNIGLSILVPFYSWPFTIPYLLTRDIQSVYYMVVLDIRTGEAVLKEFSFIHAENKDDITVSTLYDFFTKFKQNTIEKAN